MSPARRLRLARKALRTCACCSEIQALFRYRGVVKADREHNLCFRCYRAEVNRQRQRVLNS
jgi:uncharacterized protein involved in tolerance to divalent cations